MHTQKQFDCRLLERFRRFGRGTGTFEQYISWHRNSRSDPASMGRGHNQLWHGRLRDLLSDLEQVAFFFATMVFGVIDIREQFPLSLSAAPHELASYTSRSPTGVFLGTIELAKRIFIRHPKVRCVCANQCDQDYWVATTDFLLTVRMADGSLFLLAVAVKPTGGVITERTRQKLLLEKTYWEEREVVWLLVTPDIYDDRVGLTLLRTAGWATSAQIDACRIELAIRVVENLQGRPLRTVLEKLALELGDPETAKNVFWQAAWSGKLPIDLRTGWRPHEPVWLMSAADFNQLNPIAARRSAWIG